MPCSELAGLAGLLVAAALVGGTIIGSVAAATAPPAPRRSRPPAAAAERGARPDRQVAEYCAAFRKAFAADLGVDESALAPAAKKAADRDDRRRRRGGRRCTTAAGDRLKARIDAADGDGCPLLAGRIGRIAALGPASAGPGQGGARRREGRADRRREGARHHPGRARLDAARRPDAQGRRHAPRASPYDVGHGGRRSPRSSRISTRRSPPARSSRPAPTGSSRGSRRTWPTAGCARRARRAAPARPPSSSSAPSGGDAGG